MKHAVPPQLEVLFRDNELLAINKPAALPVHGSRILEGRPDTLLKLARKQEGCLVHAVHRLDRPVSGVILLARNLEVLAEMSRAFENRQVRKCYLAVVRGWPESTGVVSHPLGPPRDERKSGSIAREAVTHYESIARVELPFPVHPYPASRYSLLALYPQTGRRHQLRRHMKHISHHLVGDTTYGRGEHNRLFREQLGCRRLLLHAWSLEFEHPLSRQQICIQASLDIAFQGVIERLGWSEALESRAT
jgi:tRNA pseudouridine65 synthase